MSSTASELDRKAAPPARWMVWTGRVVSALPILMMLMSASMKLARPPQVMEQFVENFGYPVSTLPAIALAEIACALLYAFPPTSVLGAILTTGYLGGAIATHARIEEVFVGPLVLGILVWLGLYLRDPRLRALIPVRGKPSL